MRVSNIIFATFLTAASTAFAQQTPPAPAPIPHPTIPARIFALPDFGALGDGKTLCTGALKEAISAASKAGGGVVLVPAGEASGNIFLTGSFALASNVELRIEKGAVLRFSANPDDFPVKSSRHEDGISCRGAHDIAVTGEGTIDGNGAWWWELYAKPSKKSGASSPNPASLPRRPYLIAFAGCQRLRLENVQIENSPSVAVQVQDCSDVTLDHLKISAPDDSPGTDGIDLSGHNIAVMNSSFDVGEDDICAKPTGDGTPDQPQCSNIQIANCSILHGKGIVIGGQTNGCLRNMTVSHCTFDGTQYALRMRSERGRGGLVENVSYDNITMTNVKFPIYLSSFFPTIPKTTAEEDRSEPAGAGTPVYHNISFSNVTASGCLTAGSVVGLPEQPMQDITFTSVDINAAHPMEITHAKGIRFVSSHIGVDKGKPAIVRDAEVTGLDGLANPGDALP